MLRSDCSPLSREDWQEVRTRVVDAEGSRPSTALEVELTIVRVELPRLGSGGGCPCCRKKADGSGVDRRVLSFSTGWQCAYTASCALVSRSDKLPVCLSMEGTAENNSVGTYFCIRPSSTSTGGDRLAMPVRYRSAKGV